MFSCYDGGAKSVSFPLMGVASVERRGEKRKREEKRNKRNENERKDKKKIERKGKIIEKVWKKK